MEGELSIEIDLQHKMPDLQFYGLKLLNHRDLLFAVRRECWGGFDSPDLGFLSFIGRVCFQILNAKHCC